MLGLAIDGITSLSVKPLQMITGFGVFVAVVSFIGCLWALITAICGKSVAGWASMTCIVCFVSGVQLVCLASSASISEKSIWRRKNAPDISSAKGRTTGERRIKICPAACHFAENGTKVGGKP